MVTEALLEEAPRQSRRHVWSRPGLAALVVLVAVGAWHWTFRPDEFYAYKPMSHGAYTLMNLGETQAITQFVGPDNNAFHDSTVDLERVTPIITENSAQATVHVLLCTPKNPVAGSGSLSDFCRRDRPFRASKVNFGNGTGQLFLILAITPHRLGRIDIKGLEVRYRDGIRRASEHTGSEISARTI